VNKNIDLLLLH